MANYFTISGTIFNDNDLEVNYTCTVNLYNSSDTIVKTLDAITGVINANSDTTAEVDFSLTDTENEEVSYAKVSVYFSQTNYVDSEIATTGKITKDTMIEAWVSKTWSNLTSFQGSLIWKDNAGNIYYSNGSTHYYLYVSTGIWTKISFTGLTDFYGNHIWTDGTYTYYSYNGENYILNTTDRAWAVKTWTNLTNFDGQNVWADGSNIYYSAGESSQYILDGTTWNTKDWSGYESILYGWYIWTDGTTIYCSNSNLGKQLYFTDNNAWALKTWTGYSNINGTYVWNNGNKYYYSNGTLQYEFDTDTSSWTAKVWSGLENFSGSNIWTDGTTMYYSDGTSQYALTEE